MRLNPLRVHGLSIPPELVVVARALALTLVVLRRIPYSRHLPYAEVFDHIGTTAQFDGVVRLLAGAGVVLVFLGPYIRTGCLLVGATTLVGLLACRSCSSVADTYAACVFLLLALSSHATGPWLLRMQVVVLYAGASLDKALDPDWWNGRFIETLLIARHGNRIYAGLAGLLPPLALSQVVGILTILTEAALVVLFLRRRSYSAGIVVVIALHSAMVLMLGTTFGPFYAAILLSCLAFGRWPRRVDVSLGDRRLRTVAVDVDGTRFRGLAALPRMALTCPAAYACFAVALAFPGPTAVLHGTAVVAIVLLCVTMVLTRGHGAPAAPVSPAAAAAGCRSSSYW